MREIKREIGGLILNFKLELFIVMSPTEAKARIQVVGFRGFGTT